MELPRLALIFLPLAGIVAPTTGASPSATARPRNVLFILTDQHRQDGVGAYGNPVVKTPHLDQLARGGIRFERSYTAQPVCAPNRASILSGLYPFTHGLRENGWPLSPRTRTLAKMLAAHGYATGYFGKWHLGRGDSQGFATFPNYPGDGRGRDHYYTIDGMRRYATDVLTDDAIGFLRQTRAQPFFLFVSYYPPHPPYSVPPEYEERYRAQFPDDAERRIYYAMCTKVDESIGRLLDALHELGRDRDTLVAFTSEHGHYFETRWNDHPKRLCYDTAARVPLLMRLPGVIPAGQVTRELISAVDLVPTILGLVGQPVPEGLQGQDLSGLAKGTAPGRDAAFMINFPFIIRMPRPDPVLKFNTHPDWRHEERAVVNRAGWKLILSAAREPELYFVPDDPDERNNRFPAMRTSDEVRGLAMQVYRWAIETGDSVAPRLVQDLLPQ